MEMKALVKQARSDRLAIRVQPDLYNAIAEAAEKSGGDVSDQVRFELMQIRGMWKGPMMPTQPAGKGKDS